MADGGTVFLDEIADLPMEAQVKLLRAIAGSEIVRVGGTRPEKIDIRLVCATNKNIQKEIDAGNFREDLYYRLNVFEIRVPPLRERLEDIDEMVEYFVRRSEKSVLGEGISVGIAPKFLEGLKKYSWPGNVRQLQSVLEREMHHLAAPYELAHLPDVVAAGGGREKRCEPGEIRPLSQMEREMITAALRSFGWDMEKVCARLEISRATLYRKINQYGLARPGI